MFFRRFPLSGAWDTSHYPKEVPFEVPEGWAMSTVMEAFQINPKNHEDDSTEAGFVPMANISDGFEDKYSYEVKPWKSIKSGFTHFRNRDIAVAKISPCLENRKSFVARGLPQEIGAGTTELFIFRSSQIIPEYGLLFFKSEFFISNCVGTFNGVVGQQRVARTIIEEMPFPIPPIAEQERIVQSVNSIFTMISEVENNQSALKNSIEKSKALILDLAIHGKLVPQDSSDEPAIALLKRINPDFQPSYNLHYEGNVPTGWVTTRLGDIVDIISGTSFQKTDITTPGTGLKILRGGNIQNGHIVLCDDDIHISEQLINERANVKKGDIVIVASTGSSELIGKAALSYQDYPRTQIGAFLRIIRPRSVELSDYLGIIFQSELYKKHIREVAKGTNINNIKASYITDFMVPMPLLNEQKRIILRLRALLDILNTINYPE